MDEDYYGTPSRKAQRTSLIVDNSMEGIHPKDAVKHAEASLSIYSPTLLEPQSINS